MGINGFTEEDFDRMEIEGLEPRMKAITEHIRPKLEYMGQQIAPHLSTLCGEDMHPHVAKHARRTVNPPDDTWVAWSNNKRGYKSLPHFQLGIWPTHLFIQFAIIYECQGKAEFAARMERSNYINHIPNHYFFSWDHMKPQTIPKETLTPEQWKNALHRLKSVKSAEWLCGLRLERKDPRLQDMNRLIQTAEEVFTTLVPLYPGADPRP